MSEEGVVSRSLTDLNEIVIGSMGDKLGFFKNGVNFIKDNIKDLIDEHDENPLMDLLPRIMEWVEDMGKNGIDGPQKKKIVLRLLMWIVENSNDLGLEKVHEHAEKLTDFLTQIAPGLIDLLIAATRGKLSLNKAVETAQGCFSFCCFPSNDVKKL